MSENTIPPISVPKVPKFNVIEQVIKRCTWEIIIQEDANIFKLLNTKRVSLICA